MTILTSFRERVLRSFLSFKTGLIFLFILWLFSAPVGLTAQDCPPDLFITGPSAATWTAPDDQGPGPWHISITARGAGGGDQGGGNLGGQGAEIIAEFIVQNGETVLAIAGEPGFSGDTDAGGGGGGSGAVNCGVPANCLTGVILVVAAGGNGGENQGAGLGGLSLNGAPGAGGVGGGANGGGGGGGMLTAGLPGGDGTGGGQVSSIGLVPGGFGNENNNGGEGMGGGGGGGSHPNNGSGGGAGRSGGAGGNTTAATSYIHASGQNVQGTDGVTGQGPSPGTVTITCLGSLPIHLINFKAVLLDQEVKLVWSTATEKDNHGFDIERSADNRNWTTLGFVPGHGTTAEKSEYAFTDDHPLAGVNYYRLKQMDTDGSFQHTPMVVADVHANALQFDIFPNPSTDGTLTFRTVSQREGEAQVEIWDWAGYKVWNETQRLWEGTTVWPVPMTNFPKGTYSVRLQMPDGTVQFKKIVLQ